MVLAPSRALANLLSDLVGFFAIFTGTGENSRYTGRRTAAYSMNDCRRWACAQFSASTLAEVSSFLNKSLELKKNHEAIDVRYCSRSSSGRLKSYRNCFILENFPKLKHIFDW